MSSWSRALVWSLIAAAFIGPGTVTTAARAGTEGGWHYSLFLLLAAVAGYLLMEMAARLTLVSGQTLGQILGNRGKGLALACFLAVLLGCIAYQAGNLLGALGGMQLIVGGSRWWLLALALPAFIVLWTGDTKKISGALAAIVGLMGLVFVAVALGLLFGPTSLAGAGKVETNTIVALIGTTIVPYNFFLAAGLSQGQLIGDMRRGLLVSFIVGALITLSIVLVGSVASSFTNFADLARTLDASLWGKGNEVLGIGLFAAGFSSAVTAPLAASLAGRELLSDMLPTDFGNRSTIFRTIWIAVLGFGLFVALLELDIITVILAAQVANGLLLPLIAAIVLVFANDRRLLGIQINANWQNIAGLLVAGFLASKNFELLLGKVFSENGSGYWGELLTLLYLVALAWLMYRQRRIQ